MASRRLTETQLYREIDKLLVRYAGKNLDGQPHISVQLTDRRVYEPMHYFPVPMTHRPLYYRPDLGETMTEADWQESLSAAINNVEMAADVLGRIQKCYKHEKYVRDKREAKKPTAV